MKRTLRSIYPILILIVSIVGAALVNEPSRVFAKNRLDLDDLEIKGELLNDDRLVILARERNELKNYVKFRTSFRPEMIEVLPSPAPGVRP